jgi:valyl-tRNA synthetase
VDPSTTCPSGLTEEQRGKPGGFIGDPDVMDTWATSSLTPHIAGGWVDDPDLFARVFPMDMRPQGHDIIRTWLFGSVVRSHHEHGCLPWTHAAISGWILDPDRKKMSKSKGNVVTPINLLQDFGTDAVRYWAASARAGVDTAFDDGQMKIGRKLGTKLLNATKFVLGFGAPPDDAVPDAAIDRAMLARLAEVVDESTRALDEFDYARAMERTEAFFWWFCDDYVELVKGRAYGTQGDDAAHSARAALRQALDIVHRLFAPFLPFVTEEVWSWWRECSVHSTAWPDAQMLPSDGDVSLLAPVSEVLGVVRRAKTEAKLSQRATVDELTLEGPSEVLTAIEACRTDLAEAGGITLFTLSEGANLATTVRLAPSTDARTAN